MTTHADRDRSEPYWPPAATREPRVRCTCAVKCNTAHVCAEIPQAVWLDDSEIKAVVARYLDSHPEEKAELDRLAQGDIVRRFPLEDGDTGAALLPVAPAGTILRCPVCPAALADTRGGRLDHCDDGSHHYVPAQPVIIPPIPRPCRGCGVSEAQQHIDDCPAVIEAVNALPGADEAHSDVEPIHKFAQAIYDVGVDHPMWIGDDGKPLDYLPARETRLADFVYQAAADVMAVADAEKEVLRVQLEAADAAAERRMDKSIEWMERAEAAEAKVARAKGLYRGESDSNRHAYCISPSALRDALADPAPEAAP